MGGWVIAQSPILITTITLKRLGKQGVEILACTTCLEYFDLTDKLVVGKPTTMLKSIQSMLDCDVVSL